MILMAVQSHILRLNSHFLFYIGRVKVGNMGKQSRHKREGRELPAAQQTKRNFAGGFENALPWIIKAGVFLTLFCPLIISKYSFFPFVTPKTIVFRVLAEIVIGAYVLLAVADKRYRPKFNTPLTIAISLFMLVLVIASFAGINFVRSFWSTYERMTGLLTLFHLYGLYIVLISVFKKKQDWRWLLAAAVAVGVLLSFYILLSDRASSRGGGTIGNTSFMATYLLFDIFFAIILLLAESRAWQIYSAIALLIMVINLMTSSAQGAIVFFFAGLLLMALGFFWLSKRKLLKALAVGLVLSGILTVILLAVFQPPFVKNTATRVWAEMEPRFAVWQAGWQAWQDRFWLGWGPENFNVAFLKYFNPCMFTAKCGQEIWFDRTHNIILDTANSAGLIGLLSYLLIFGTALVVLWLSAKKLSGLRTIFAPLGMAAILLAYFGQNLLVFDMISSYLMFFVCLAFVSFIASGKSESQGDGAAKKLHPAWSIGVGAVVVFMVIFFNIKPQAAASNVAQMIARGSNQMAQSTAYFEKSLNSWMLKYEQREQFMQLVAEAPTEVLNKDKEATQRAFEAAVRELEKSAKENPLDFRTHLFLGRLYVSFYYFSSDKANLEKSKEALNRALELSPTNQQVYWYLAETRFAETKYQESIDFLQKAIDLEPILGQSYWYLAIGKQLAGDYKGALEDIETAGKVRQPYDWKARPGDIRRVISIYSALGDQNMVFALYEEAVKLFPGDPQLWGNLAPLYAKTGQFEKAFQATKKLVELRPDLTSQVQEFIKSFPPPFNQL